MRTFALIRQDWVFFLQNKNWQTPDRFNHHLVVFIFLMIVVMILRQGLLTLGTTWSAAYISRDSKNTHELFLLLLFSLIKIWIGNTHHTSMYWVTVALVSHMYLGIFCSAVAAAAYLTMNAPVYSIAPSFKILDGHFYQRTFVTNWNLLESRIRDSVSMCHVLCWRIVS